MGLLVECPTCRYRNSLKANACKGCGAGLKKTGGKAYWIEYYDETGARKRERIGQSKAAAEQRYRDVLKARTENRHIHRDRAARMTFGELWRWYKDLPEVTAKASYDRDLISIANLSRILGDTTKLSEITAGAVEGYQRKRLEENSPVYPGRKVRPSTVNREVACLRGMINRAISHGKLDVNPISRARRLQENNVRERVLTREEFERLLENCAPHLQPVVLMAYYTGMRRAEILFLTWSEVDLSQGFIRLKGDRTKTGTARVIPLHSRVAESLRNLPRGLRSDRVFLRGGEPFDDVKKSFASACRRAEITDFRFHDLRHCAINNLRLAGNDYFKIMAMSGHKTTSVFQRYNVVTEEELKGIQWMDEAEASAE